MPISTHVLDTSRGVPAPGIAVTLAVSRGDAFGVVARAVTDGEGRIADLLAGEPLEAATYRLTFATAAYHGPETFYPEVAVTFRVDDPQRHHHVPLLLSPFGYSTYRGS